MVTRLPKDMMVGILDELPNLFFITQTENRPIAAVYNLLKPLKVDVVYVLFYFLFLRRRSLRRWSLRFLFFLDQATEHLLDLGTQPILFDSGLACTCASCVNLAVFSLGSYL
jgi:hypothetical protein